MTAVKALAAAVAASSPELQLVLRCAAAVPEPPAAVPTTAPIDFGRLVRTADHHGLLPLVAARLGAAGGSPLTGDELAALSQQAASHELRHRIHVTELVRLLRELDVRGLRVLAYKGPALAASAYPQPSLRPSRDLDLFTLGAALPEVERLLEEQGYVRSPRFMGRACDRAFVRAQHERFFLSDDGWVGLDVHWRPTPPRFPWRFDLPAMVSRAVTVTVGGQGVRTFHPEDHLLLCCAHAAKDGWSRLVWARDLDGLVRRHPDLNWQAVRRSAEKAGASRLLSLGLLLAHGLFSTPMPASALRSVERTPGLSSLAASLVREAAHLRSVRGRFDEPTDVRVLHLAVCDDAWARVRYVWRTFTSLEPGDWSRLAANDSHFALRLTWQRCRRTLRALRGAARALAAEPAS